ncbi:MAG: 50S ribosomal protein L11 methyltransferase [Deltaproteobacteria bacterium]|nr:MAG: 50S ribosomal protein L11 methyltransferase [Deltaproteobacteria bacterium]
MYLICISTKAEVLSLVPILNPTRKERAVVLDPEQPLHVYEVKGGVPPSYLDLEGLLGVWPEADYTYLFFTAPADTTLRSFFREHPEFRLTRHYQLDYGQWQQIAPQEPLVIDRFKIITKQQQVQLAPGEILLWIDPGVIFGSGLHPTTRSCLRALLTLYRENKPSKVLDLGTGTGILAIAAAKLGAASVEALDLNPMAIATAAANCRRNGVAGRVRLRKADAHQHLPAAELVCVNIHFDFLETFFKGTKLCRYRWAIVGGFLIQKLQEVVELLPTCAELKEPKVEETGWVTLILEIDRQRMRPND